MLRIKRKQGNISYHFGIDHEIEFQLIDLEVSSIQGDILTLKRKKNELEDYIDLYNKDPCKFMSLFKQLDQKHSLYSCLENFVKYIELQMDCKGAKIGQNSFLFNDKEHEMQIRGDPVLIRKKLNLSPTHILYGSEMTDIYELEEKEYHLTKLKVMAEYLEINRPD